MWWVFQNLNANLLCKIGIKNISKIKTWPPIFNLPGFSVTQIAPKSIQTDAFFTTLHLFTTYHTQKISIHSLNPSNIMIFPTFIFLQYICPIQLLNLTYAPQHICFSFTILNPAKTHSSPIQKHQCSIGSQENIHYKSNYTFQFQILINWVSKQTKNPLYWK